MIGKIFQLLKTSMLRNRNTCINLSLGLPALHWNIIKTTKLSIPKSLINGIILISVFNSHRKIWQPSFKLFMNTINKYQSLPSWTKLVVVTNRKNIQLWFPLLKQNATVRIEAKLWIPLKLYNIYVLAMKIVYLSEAFGMGVVLKIASWNIYGNEAWNRI